MGFGSVAIVSDMICIVSMISIHSSVHDLKVSQLLVAFIFRVMGKMPFMPFAIKRRVTASSVKAPCVRDPQPLQAVG